MSKPSFSEQFGQKMKKSSNSLPYLSIFDPGEYVFRLLPIPSKPNEPAFEQYDLHPKIYHPDFDNYSQFVCLGLGCPICDFAEQFKRQYPKDAWSVVRTQYFYWRIENKKTKSMNLLKLTYSAQVQLGTEILNLDRQGISLQDPSEYGRDIRLTVQKVNNKISYKFEAMMAHESTPVNEKILEELSLWDKIKPLDKLFRIYSREDLFRIVNNQSVKFEKKEDSKKKAISKSSLSEQFKNKMNSSGISDLLDDKEDKKNE